MNVRALEIDDAIREALCEAVIGAHESGAALSEVSVQVALTTAAKVNAGVEVGLFAASGEASITSSGTVIAKFNQFPSVTDCRALLERESQGYEIRRGEAVPLM